MCGIVGFCNLNQNLQNNNYKNVLNNMREEISKRGPDEEGFYYSTHCMLGHKRLIVVDPKGGLQPMLCEYNGNTYSIVYNGQLYNTEDLRKELLNCGFSFNGHSDTEVLLKSFIKFGYDVVNKLNGIYGFAVWNENKQELFIARDHFGVKPLYFSTFNDTFIFASEVKSILSYPRYRT